MALSSFRNVSITVPVGKEDVLVTMYEEYADDSGAPTHIKVVGPNGLMTEGKPAAAWQEMLELLGVAPNNPAVNTPQSAVSKSQESVVNKGEPAAHDRVFAEDDRNSESEQGSQSQNTAVAAFPASADVAVAGVHEATGSPVPVMTQEQNPAAAAMTTSIQSQETVEAAGRVPVMGVLSAAVDEMEDDMELEEEREEQETDVEKEPPLNRNILQESMLRLLNRRLYSDDPPLKIDEKMVAFIPYLNCTQEAANLIQHIDENVRLTEMQADAARRAANLKYLQKANRAKRCGHLKFNGESCGSPALRGEQYCHFHAQAHADSMELPVIEDQRSLQLAYTKLASQVAAKKIAPEQASVLLRILESAGRNLPNPENSELARRFPGT